jgi:hypothetical protein
MDTASSADTFGIRGAGATWQADFGMPLDEADLLFAARRDSIGNRVVFQFAHDVFDNWFEVEELSEKPDPKFNEAVQRVLEALDAKAVFTQMAVFERIFGWAIIALTYVDYGADISRPVESPRQIARVQIVERRQGLSFKALSAMLAIIFDMTRGLAISNVKMLIEGGFLKLDGEEVVIGEEKIE